MNVPAPESCDSASSGASRAGFMHVVFCLWAGGRWLWPSRITAARAVASELILVSAGALTHSWKAENSL